VQVTNLGFDQHYAIELSAGLPARRAPYDVLAAEAG
jgi:hypothetical protein